MGSFPGATANFNEPQSDDTTSAPQIQLPQGAQQTSAIRSQVAGSLANALAQRKKQQGIKVKAPATLTAAIARARKGRPSSEKYG